jgi:hypothetical protein
MAFETPIVFLIFNRPRLAEQVFRQIARQRPKYLVLIADGPRPNQPQDIELTNECRRICTQIDWPCDLRTNFAETNLGCRRRVSSGITWAFNQFEEAVILEDDCLPHDSFFEYSLALLTRYRHDSRVMMISGNNFQPKAPRDGSYYFSRWTHIWGWATWRRAWTFYDVDIADWPEVRAADSLRTSFDLPGEYERWSMIFDELHANRIDTWDYQWAYACWKNRGLTILPQRNLVSNLGFGCGATHTTDAKSPYGNLQTWEINELVHPPRVVRNVGADVWTSRKIFGISDGGQNPHVNGHAVCSDVKTDAGTRKLSAIRRLLRHLRP